MPYIVQEYNKLLIILPIANAPDILGYIYTMTQGNPHIRPPEGGNTLGGLERARYLAAKQVQLADVARDQAVGHLAFRSVNNSAAFAEGKLEKWRM